MIMKYLKQDLQKDITPEEYEKRIIKLWGNIDHSYMNKNIEEVKKMVLQKNFENKDTAFSEHPQVKKLKRVPQV